MNIYIYMLWATQPGIVICFRLFDSALPLCSEDSRSAEGNGGQNGPGSCADGNGHVHVRGLFIHENNVKYDNERKGQRPH